MQSLISQADDLKTLEFNLKQFNWERKGEVEVLCRESLDLGTKSKAIILFHGYGADASDLASLSQFLDPEGVHSWYFPDGIGSTPFGGKAWFEIDYKALEKAMASGVDYDFSNRKPAGLAMAHEMTLSCVQDILKNHESFVIGGFSQGAMIAVDLLLGEDLSPERLIVLSGAPIDLEKWEGLQFKNPEQRFFQSHGRSDQVIGFERAKKLNQFLISKKAKGPFEPFDGGHEIPIKILEKIKPMLSVK